MEQGLQPHRHRLDRGEILTHHLLDSLAAQPDLLGTRIADVGTGAGFPGLPLAIVNPARQFTLIDAVDKKLRFIDHVARELGLANVRTLPRARRATGPRCLRHRDRPRLRAAAAAGRLGGAACGPRDPGHRHEGALAAARRHRSDADGGPLPAGWRIEAVRAVAVPGLAEARHHVLLRHGGAP